MVYETTLCHHGVKGQKWGVRRYQNRDGSLTNAGKKKRNKFSDFEKKVTNKLSNSYSKFVKRPIDISKIMSRGNIDSKDAKICIGLAKDLFNKSSKVEPKITKDVISSVSRSGCKMYGLEHRLKQPTSIAGKIASDSKEKNISYKEAANAIKDSIRYTSVSDTRNFVKNYNGIKSQLETRGYEEIKCKNYFESYRQGKVMHKSVQSTFKDKDGNVFELQFQTPSSQTAKELKLPLYEERRRVGISEARAKELESGMRYLANKVKDPKDIDRILSHSDISSETTLCHHGVKGQKWGVRRYQNPDGSLTSEGKIRSTARNRVIKANKTRGDVDTIVNSLSKQNKKMLNAENGYLSFEQGEHVVKRFLLRDGDIPMAFMDFLSDGKNSKGQTNLDVAIAVNESAQGKGYGSKIAKKGTAWIEKNIDKFGDISWAALQDNIASQKLAEKTGWSHNKKRSNDEWKVYSK